MAVLTVIFQYIAVVAIICFFFYRNAILNSVNRVLKPIPITESTSQENRLQAKRKLKSIQQSTAKQTTQEPMAMTTTSVEPERPADDATFAREFSLAQRGTRLTKRTSSNTSKARTKKQGNVEKIDIRDQRAAKENQFSELVTSANAGHPISPIEETASYPMGMETDYQSHAASSLRVTSKEAPAPIPSEAEWTNIPTKSQKVQRKVERAEETKKQRQRQAQKEQLRELKDEADRKQRVLMERQRRDARIARGESAKNGESYQKSSVPPRSVWSQPSQPPGTLETQSFLLDTIEGSPSATAGPIIANGEEVVANEGNVPTLLP